MSTSDFEQYKVDHLFLLIGENPLPNYVAARLLLSKDGTAYLVHTTSTEPQAKRLQRILKSEVPSFKDIQLLSLNNWESDAYHIQDEIRRKVKSIKDGRIGMNYTGGTKAMAVHAYRTLFKENRLDTVFSYLDPRRLEMCIDREDRKRDRIKVTPQVLEVKLAKVFQIHGWTWQSEPVYEPELPEAAHAFAQFHKDATAIDVWRNWCNQILREEARNPKDRNKWKNETQLQQVSPLNMEMLKTYTEIKSTLALIGATGEVISLQAVQNKGFKNLESVCQWLDGEWLEHYVLQQVKTITASCSIYESATSFWIRDPNTGNTKFQFDVAFMRGYQLFAISCTTITRKSDCKQKLFEAYIRAQQLGGSEARVALVCCASPKDVNALRTEITNVLKPEPEAPVKDHKIAVFGQDDLMELSDQIAEWIDKNVQEAK